jgi:glyoxylase-like metal-dependent hydrolase (beta-lactamase superfamily II)
MRLSIAAAPLIAASTLLMARAAPVDYTVHAVRFAHVPYAARNLVAGVTDRTRMVDIAFTVWVVQGGGRTILVDAGFYRDKFVQQWKPQDYVRPSEAVRLGLGIAPESVTDIVVTHSHWDHMDGVDLFPKATIHIQRDEREYYVGPMGEVLHTGGVDADDAKMLAALADAGRVRLVEGDAREILPGLTAYTGGKHTWASQYVGVTTRDGVVVLASDNAYLYENLEGPRAIAQTLDPASNVAAQTRMLSLAASPGLVVPGHDPAVFDRYPRPGLGVALIAPRR